MPVVVIRRPRRPIARRMSLPPLPVHTPLVSLAPLSRGERGMGGHEGSPLRHLSMPLSHGERGAEERSDFRGVCAWVSGLHPRRPLARRMSLPPLPVHTPLVALAPLSRGERGMGGHEGSHLRHLSLPLSHGERGAEERSDFRGVCAWVRPAAGVSL